MIKEAVGYVLIVGLVVASFELIGGDRINRFRSRLVRIERWLKRDRN